MAVHSAMLYMSQANRCGSDVGLGQALSLTYQDPGSNVSISGTHGSPLYSSGPFACMAWPDKLRCLSKGLWAQRAVNTAHKGVLVNHNEGRESETRNVLGLEVF